MKSGKYEVALRTRVDMWASGKQPPPSVPFKRPTEPVRIEFEGRTFVWFPGDEEDYPSVAIAYTTQEYEEERQLIQRFLSALSYHLGQPIAVAFEAAQMTRSENSPPLARAQRGGSVLLSGPTRLLVSEDPHLRLCLALLRDASSSESPFYEFLGYYKVLEVAGGGETQRDRWISEHVEEFIHEWRPLDGEGGPPSSWPAYFRDSSRNAIAHALRRKEGAAHIDLDVPGDRARLGRDARFLKLLAGQAVAQRWPQAVKGEYR